MENTLAHEEGITANLNGDGVLQETGWNEEEKKGCAVFGNNTRPPDQFSAAQCRAIQTIPGPRAAHQPGKQGTGLRPRDESGTLKIESDEEASRRESYLDGCDVIKTDMKESEADRHLLHDRYKDLTELEKVFRGCRW